jgi:ferredoxin
MDSLHAHLSRYDERAWTHAIDLLAPEIHVIDRDATRIWFAFFPLDLFLALEAAGSAEERTLLERKFGLMGKWRLAEQIDESHRFLYSHRYWPNVKSAISAVEELPTDLAELMTRIADAAGRTARVDRDQLLGITAVGLMTLRQVGAAAFAAAQGKIHLTPEARRLSPHQVLANRGVDDWQGLLGFTRGIRKRWTVTFDENDPAAKFTLINDQEIASAAQTDSRDYHARDPRCTPNEGPIPVECRAASCGTCWVGVLAGAEKLSPVVEREEGRRMKVFGYAVPGQPKPIIRLACQARATGAVSIVIPPWNGIFGKVTSPR